MEHGVVKPGSNPLVRHEIEFLPSGRIMQLPPNITALYVLYSHASKARHMNVRFVGYANNEHGEDVRTLLRQQHRINGRLWTHFSVYELWDHFQKDDNRSVEALFEQVYRHDSQLQTYLARNKRIETRGNVFIPKKLFVSFVDRISRASSKVIDPMPVNPATGARFFER